MVFLIIGAILLVLIISVNIDTTKKKEKKASKLTYTITIKDNNGNIKKTQHEINTQDIDLRKIQRDKIEHEKKLLRLKRREKRYERNDKIRIVVEYIEALGEINDLDSLYSYEDLYKRFKSLTEKSKPQKVYFDVAFRYFHQQYIQGNCTYNLTYDDKKLIRSFQMPDFNKLLVPTLDSFEIYWKNVLDNYKRNSARIKRIHYLIDLTNTFMTKSYVLNNEEAIKKVKYLNNLYINMLQDNNAAPNNSIR